jgi:hypothetical protein
MTTAAHGAHTSEAALVPAVRRLAAALRTGDRDHLPGSLSAALRLLPSLGCAWLELADGPSGHGANAFPTEVVTIPIRNGTEVIGTLRQPVGEHALGASHLRLLAAMAELAGAVLARTGTGRAAPRSDALVAHVLEHVPVGAMLLSPKFEVLAANSRVPTPLLQPARATAFFSSLGTGREHAAGVRLASCDDRTLVVHLHPAPDSGSGAPAILALLHDLSRQVAEFGATVAREVFRARATGQPLTLALASAGGETHRLLGVVDQMRAQTDPAAGHGPVDARVFGVVLPGWRVDALRRRLRAQPGEALPPDVELAAVELEEREEPERFLARGVAGLGPRQRLVRPVVLLYDTSPSVTDALAVVLGRECEVVVCHDRGEAAGLLAARAFDAVFADIEPDEREKDVALVQRAVAMQPGVAAFLLTAAPGPYHAELAGLPEGTPVFRKPFAVHDVREAVRRAIGAPK